MSIPAELEPGLYIVATPIGNLEDITLRGLRVLAGVDVIYAEDTRRTRVLLAANDLHVRLQSLPAHAEQRRIGAVLEDLEAGRRVALCTDAGTPGVSDPGSLTVRASRDAGHTVHVIPGVSALTTALAGSGLGGGGGASFLGFLPRSPGKLRRTLELALTLGRPVVFFESPLRLATTLRQAQAVLGEREIIVARELTKLHEQWHRGTATELMAEFAEVRPRGECTVLVSADEPAA